MLLVAVLAELRETWPLGDVLFVDHGLRDVGAERSAARAAAERCGATFTALTVRLDAQANLQAAAREARYAALLGAVPAPGLICTAHTATDQAETLLQRVTRGTGVRGLTGISPRRGRLVRPLLDVVRTTTRALANGFVDDPSNARGVYLRNRLRHDVLPLLRAENPQVEQAFGRVARAAAETLAVTDELIDRSGLFDADLSCESAPLVAAVVRATIRRQLPTAPAPSTAAVEQLVAALQSGRSSVRVSLRGGLMAHADHGRLVIALHADPRHEVVAPGPGTYLLAGRALEIVATDTVVDYSRTDSTDAAVESSPEPDRVSFPADLLVWPLKLRPVKPLDRITTSQRPGAPPQLSLISELAASAGGAPRRHVLVDGAGRALWVPGVARSGVVPLGGSGPGVSILWRRRRKD